MLGQVETLGYPLDVLQSLLDLLLVRGEVRRDEQQRGAENREANGYSALGAESCARPHAETVLLSHCAHIAPVNSVIYNN